MSDTNLLQQFDLLKQILQHNNSTDYHADLDSIQKLIFTELPEALEKNAPPNFPELYFDFKQEYERFKDFLIFDKLIGKNVVALGGGFSTGKSSFINSILDEDILPYDIDPTTSVPTYIVYGDADEAKAINTFQSTINMKVEDIQHLAHGFGIEGSDEVSLGHLLKSIFVTSPRQKFANIALLDTPGYSKSESSNHSDRTDEKIARTQLNSSNYILWFTSADDGTIQKTDVDFIKTLNPDIPKLFIINKADIIFDSDELEDIVNESRNTLIKNGIDFVDVFTYSSDDESNYDKDKILQQIEKWNNGQKESKFAYNFKKLFSRCKEYYETRLEDEKKQLSHLNNIRRADLNDEEAENYLQRLIKTTQNSILDLKESMEKLHEMQNEFFGQIKTIADKVHISMPEPSEIDLIQDRITDPKKILDDYCAKNMLDSPKHQDQINEFEEILTDCFKDIVPVFNNIPGTASHNSETANMFCDVLNIPAEQIRINDKIDN